MYPRSGFRSGGNIRQNHPFGKSPFSDSAPDRAIEVAIAIVIAKL